MTTWIRQQTFSDQWRRLTVKPKRTKLVSFKCFQLSGWFGDEFSPHSKMIWCIDIYNRFCVWDNSGVHQHTQCFALSFVTNAPNSKGWTNQQKLWNNTCWTTKISNKIVIWVPCSCRACLQNPAWTYTMSARNPSPRVQLRLHFCWQLPEAFLM